jgi:DNA repair proteins
MDKKDFFDNDNLHKEHRQRIKNRFLDSGFSSFSSHEILELLMYYSLPRVDTNHLAHRLINSFGSLARVFEAPIESLVKIPGVKEHTAILLKMVPELCRAYNVDKTTTIKSISTYEQGGEYLVSRFIGVTVEQVLLICLDNSNRIIDCSIMHEGSVNSASISTRKFAETAIHKGASSIIMAHNHPGGIAFPSDDDLNTTKALKRLFELLEVRFKEHYIIAQGSYIGILHEYGQL